MFYHQGIVLLVLCFIGYSFCISNNHHRNLIPNRRLYFYNPDLISHAANALHMIVPQALYKPLPPLQIAPHPVQLTHYSDLDDEDEDDSEDYEKRKKPNNLQLFTFIKPKKTKKKMKNNKGNKKIKKFFKKCLPFKVRIIKKSDVFKNEPLYVNNNYDNLHYTFDNQHPKEEDLALISLNTTGILENKPNIPQVLHFLYPRYNFQQPQQHKLFRKVPKPLRNKQIIRPRRPWSIRNKWRLAQPGKPVQDYPLKEPIPGTTGGSPPPSPLYNIYKDNRIPVNQNFVHQESQTKFPENNLIDKTRTIEGERYSDPDYYRYGIYDQNQFNSPPEEYNKTAEADTSVKYYYHSTFSMSPEKVITVTPATSWVPIPQIPKINKKTIQNNSSKISFKSGGFKSSNYGDKISKNCTSRFYNNRVDSFRCLEQPVLASNSSDAQFYIEEIVKPREEIKIKKKGRSNDQENNPSGDIVTAKYPEDDFNQIYISAKRSDSVRAGRSEMGLTAVVSESLLVHEN